MEVIKLKPNETLHELITNISLPTSLTIGAFDGLHIGHDALMKETIKKAKEINGKSIILSFDPHPDYVLNKRNNIGYLMTLDEKIKRLEQYGFDYFVLLPFDINMAHLSYLDFYNQYLKEINYIIVGYDYHFGYKKQGTVKKLKEIHNDVNKDHEVIIIPKVSYQEKKVASSEIRTLLEQGNIDDVYFLLGRRYEIIGKVVWGSKIGRTINFPTANIEKEDNIIFPKKGVYAVLVNLLDDLNRTYLGFANIGQNPSFNYVTKERLEVHIFDFNQDIYNKHIKITFLKRLRDEKKFSSKEELIKQLNYDKQITIDLYKELLK